MTTNQKPQQDSVEKQKDKHECEPEIIQVTDSLPGGVDHTHWVNGNVCIKCGKLL